MKTPFVMMLAATAAVMTTACTGGPSNNTPDEFRVVTKAPLTVPPEYKLRPPSNGGALPTEVDPQKVIAASAFGTTIGKDASASEKALVAAAGANAVNPVVRNQVDYDETKTIRKTKSFADKVLFWRKDAPAEGEDLTIEDNATGGADVTIERGSESPRFKLPGT